MATAKDALNAIESHERECKALYKSIDKRLEDGSKRFDKLDNMIWAVYPFIVGVVFLAKFVQGDLMPLQKLLFKPGINKEATDYANEGGWVDSK